MRRVVVCFGLATLLGACGGGGESVDCGPLVAQYEEVRGEVIFETRILWHFEDYDYGSSVISKQEAVIPPLESDLRIIESSVRAAGCSEELDQSDAELCGKAEMPDGRKFSVCR